MPDKKDPSEDDNAGRRPRPHALWTGVLSFGLVSVPVDLYPAHRSSRPALRMVTPDGGPVERRYVCPREERPVERDEIVRGYEVAADEFVVVTDDELASLAPEKSAEIDLRRFVPADAIGPAWFMRAYYLAPSGKSTKAYRLLAEALESEERIGIATFVMRGKEYLVAIIAEHGILRAETLRFPGELRSPEDVDLPAPDKPAKDASQRLLRAMKALKTGKLDTRRLEDDYAQRVAALAQKKFASGEDVLPAKADDRRDEEGAEIIDLTAVLKARLQGRDPAQARQAGRRKPGGGETLAQLSKAELYQRAQSLDVPGRSQMTKDELVAALRAHESAGE